MAWLLEEADQVGRLAHPASRRVYRSALALGILIEATAEDVGNNKHDDQEGEINNLTADAVESTQAQGHMGSWALARFSFSLDLCPPTVSLSVWRPGLLGCCCQEPHLLLGSPLVHPAALLLGPLPREPGAPALPEDRRLPLTVGLRLPGGEAGGAGLGRVVPGGRVLTLAWGPQASPSV